MKLKPNDIYIPLSSIQFKNHSESDDKEYSNTNNLYIDDNENNNLKISGDESTFNPNKVNRENGVNLSLIDFIKNIYKTPRFLSAGAVLLYGTVSLCQTIFNKKVMTTYDFNASNFLLFNQMVVTIVILHILKYFNILKINTNFEKETIKKLMPLSFCYIINVLLGLDSLKQLNIPMYSALKRLVAVVILVMEYFILKKVSPPKIIASVFVMVIGAVVAGITDLTFNSLGYSLVLLSCVFQASYLIYVKKVANNMSTYDMLYYNSVLSLPITIFLMIVNQEVEYFQTFEHLYDRSFQVYFILSIFLGFFLNFCIFFCTSVNSPLTTSVTGQIKNIASTIIGAIIFNDVIIHPINIIGLIINVIGSIWYSFLKLTSK
ncbi:hypothetical protein RB653_004860 [Dictyostelium firmibasis]|uniref:Sugar phosphate transporter domain-containing protein n=1 Tax=Dictyostelium firmibasis TaxID=79012 RepID=A0AAN7U0A6_9MYCE